METSGSPLACDQAGDAEMNQEVLSMVGPLQHTMRRKETGNLKLLNFFSPILPLSADPAGSVSCFKS